MEIVGHNYDAMLGHNMQIQCMLWHLCLWDMFVFASSKFFDHWVATPF